VSEKVCRYCSQALPVADNKGRPNEYCTSGCRRAAQSERQRLSRHIERLEAETMDLAHAVRRGDSGVMTALGIQSPKGRLEDVLADIALLKERLADLLEA